MGKNYYEIDENIYRRFEQKNEMFCRYLWDKDLKLTKIILRMIY